MAVDQVLVLIFVVGVSHLGFGARRSGALSARGSPLSRGASEAFDSTAGRPRPSKHQGHLWAKAGDSVAYSASAGLCDRRGLPRLKWPCWRGVRDVPWG
jgi:hypothetical protein